MTPDGSTMSGRYTALARRDFISSMSSAFLPHSRTSCPALAR